VQQGLARLRHQLRGICLVESSFLADIPGRLDLAPCHIVNLRLSSETRIRRASHDKGSRRLVCEEETMDIPLRRPLQTCPFPHLQVEHTALSHRIGVL
jgi:hypothetical protein